MLTEGVQINSGHQSMIHDIKYDYYGDKLASCGSDGYINVYDVSKKQQVAQIKTRDSPLFSISWSHPRFGNVIATSSYDGEISIYREQKEWSKVASYQNEGSVNCVQFMPRELLLACGTSDGFVILLDNNKNWDVENKWQAHESTIHGLCWNQDGSLLATCSADKLIKIWEFTNNNKPQLKYTIQSHLDVVKDVQFHPLENILVSGGDDGKLIVNRLDNNKVVEIQDIQYNMTIWRVSFNMLGNLLTVNGESNGQSQIQTLKQESNFQYGTIDCY
ncbi:unnamed protein product (macronuclear) [Paramecium tetraurelia]|uniref:Vps41 beta-propeller domain-containing protein n=1 Tax=Paramecium tetraurelia TaxID=5888 RepID=A0DJZ3_PARTE|nr:uncharacterized protein GSPATT00017704001 [Paramecium tetraurelia]CAK83360.1 unnamed protein product [Paramecium tetraurelia]|eukprot:XP_001450757.1 hypothetical protein (macronuclear) [Paramecium tetraurelia strain d4-2]